MNELDRLLGLTQEDGTPKAANAGEVQVPTGPAQPPVPVSEVSGTETPQAKTSTAPELDALLSKAAGEGQTPQSLDEALGFEQARQEIAKQAGLGSTFVGGVQRGVAQVRSTVPALQGLYLEMTGDLEGSRESFAAAQEIERSAPEPVVPSISNINNVDDFAHWFAERFGEQAPVLATTFTGVGAGTGVATVVGKGFLTSASKRALLTRMGQASGALVAGTGLETAGTAQEQFAATGSSQPYLSVGAGIVKGALDTYTPLKFLADVKAGNLVGGVLRTAAREGVTEGLQESVDVGARLTSDPEYRNTFWDKPLRIVDAAAAGFAVGGGVGAIGSAAQRAIKGKDQGETVKVDDVSKFPAPTSEMYSMAPFTPMEQLRAQLENAGENSGITSRVFDAEAPDFLGVGSFMGQIDSGQAVQQITDFARREAFKIAASDTKKYVVSQPYGLDEQARPELERTVLSDVDLEVLLSSDSHDKRRDIYEVDVNTLDPLSATVTLDNLPDFSSTRVYAVGVPKETFEESYKALKDLHTKVADDVMRSASPHFAKMLGVYKDLVAAGLRVLPDPGESFIYTGSVTGKKLAAAPLAQRSIQVVQAYKYLNKASEFIKAGTRFTAKQSKVMSDYIALDFNKLTADNVLLGSEFSEMANLLEYPSGMHEMARGQYRMKFINASIAGSYKELKDLADIGVFLPVEYGRMPTTDIYLRKDIATNVLVAGVHPRYNILDISQPSSRFRYKSPIKFIGEVDQKDPAIRERGLEIASIVNNLLPFLSEITRTLGMKNITPIVIDFYSDGEASRMGPYFTIGRREIVLPADFDYTQFGVDLKTIIDQVVLHEFGHMAVNHFWEKLPLYAQQGIMEDYNKALMHQRLTLNAYRTQTSFYDQNDPRTTGNVSYWLTFNEYLAEQFRRWASSNAIAMNRREKFYREGGEIVKKLYASFAERYGEKAAQELMTPGFGFTRAMDYVIKSAEEGNSLFSFSLSKLNLDSDFKLPSKFDNVTLQVRRAIEEFRATMPANIELRVDPTLRITPGADPTSPGNIMFGGFQHEAKLLQLYVGSIAYARYDESKIRALVAHEAFHAVQSMLSVGELAVLNQAAVDAKALSPELEAEYRAAFTKAFEEGTQFDAATRAEMVEQWIGYERIAHMIELRVRGQSFTPQVNALLDAIYQFIIRVRNLLAGNGFITADDVTRAFFSGELARRADQGRRFTAQVEKTYKALQVGRDRRSFMSPDKIEKLADDLYVAVQYTGEKPTPNAVTYRFYAKPITPFTSSNLDDQLEELGREKGFIDVEFVDPVKGFDIAMMQVHNDFQRKGNLPKFLNYVESDLGTTFKASGVFLEPGYQVWKRRHPDQVAHHVWNAKDEVWLSPNFIRRHRLMWEEILKKAKVGKSNVKLDAAERSVQKFKALEAQIDPKYYKDKKNLAAHSMTSADAGFIEFRLNEVRKGFATADDQLVEAVTGVPQPATMDDFTQVMAEATKQSIAKNAEELGIPVELAAPRQFELASMQNIFNAVRSQKNPPQVNATMRSIQAQADRISWFSKLFFGLHQLAWRNPHIPTLRDYLSLVERWNTRRMEWISRADKVAKLWMKTKEPNIENLNELFFWLTEMNYRTPAEIRAGTVRHPTQQEMQKKITQLKLGPKALDVYTKVRDEFADFLDKVEQVTADRIRAQNIQNPQALRAALTKLQSEFAQMRKKPYFPMVRFGQYTITVRDANMQDKVVWFSAYPTIRERDAAVRAVSLQYPGLDLFVGRMPEESQEFLGLPGPLLDQIKQHLPGLTAAQRDWLDQMQLLNAPERSFRKRWLERKNTPGYSMDALRVFASYFRSGTNYLARIEYQDAMRKEVDSTFASMRTLKNSTKRSMVYDYMQRHFNYIMEGGKDWAKFKALVSIYQLGFSPAAAMMNLLQTPQVTLPYLGGIYGNTKATAATLKAVKAVRNTMGLPNLNASPDYLKAREEMVAQGKIDVGQAAELGSYADTANLAKLSAGTLKQRAWTSFATVSMFGFQVAESMNREIAFKAAYDLAIADPNNKHLVDIQIRKFSELTELVARTGMSYNAGVATLAGREALDRTQFIYQPWARPVFLRNKVGSSLLVFFSYMQNMLYAMGNNSGARNMLLISFALYGMMGLPGAGDLDWIIRALARKFMGKDWDPQYEARKFVRQLSEGTVFDEVAPDLFLHGISKFGFGIGLMPDGWGAPRFDASGNGSLGRVIPGLQVGVRGLSNGAEWNKVTGDVVSDMSGAGFGPMFSLLKFLGADPSTVEQKQWEMLLPRAFKAVSKSIRYARDGKEITRSGGTFAEFDMTDPDDRATVFAQAFGFTPTKLSSKYEAMAMHADTIAFYKSYKSSLLADLNVAMQTKDPGAKMDVMDRIKDYNAKLKAEDIPSLSITGRAVLQSLTIKTRNRVLEEQGLPKTKVEVPVQRNIFLNYPLVEMKRVK